MLTFIEKSFIASSIREWSNKGLLEENLMQCLRMVADERDVVLLTNTIPEAQVRRAVRTVVYGIEDHSPH